MERTLEESIESYLVRKVHEIKGLCWKFTSPGTRGVPDRIVIANGQVWFVELKRPGVKKLEGQQAYRIKQLTAKGANAIWIHSKKQVDDLIGKIGGDAE